MNMNTSISKRSTQISEVVDSFDFESVKKFMDKTNWDWCFPYEDKPRVPVVKEIKECAIELLEEIKSWPTNCDEIVWVSTGGFTAYKDPKTFELWLEFEFKK